MRLTALAFVILVGGFVPAALGAASPERTLAICHPTGTMEHRYVLIRVPVGSVRARLKRGAVMPANGRCP